MLPSRTDWVPRYSPHSSKAALAMMMKATRAARARERRTAVSKALCVAWLKRWDSRSSAT